MTASDILELSEDVAGALSSGRPVVALESSVISQGLPHPRNLEAALACERVVRDEGGVPATTAVIDGKIRVGLTSNELERMACRDGIEKAGARDLARVAATGLTAATTVGATLTIAYAAGIAVMATGGIGGVHRDFERTADVSNDLAALASKPVIVVSAGFKSILDLPRTLEYVETLGIPVVGYQTGALSDFYSVDSGFAVPLVRGAAEVARMFAAHRDLGLTSGIIVANPPPVELAFANQELAGFIEEAVRDASAGNISGKALTPFLLSRVAALSGGRSIDLNVALLVSNVRVAAGIATAVASL